MYKEIPEVSFVLIVFITWGKKELVVSIAAMYPKVSIVM